MRAGLFGMNLFTRFTEDHGVFIAVAVYGATLGPIVLVAIFLAWAKRQGFMSA